MKEYVPGLFVTCISLTVLRLISCFGPLETGQVPANAINRSLTDKDQFLTTAESLLSDSTQHEDVAGDFSPLRGSRICR